MTHDKRTIPAALLTLALAAHGPAAVARATRAISAALDIEPAQVLGRLAEWWGGWLEHPAYKEWQSEETYDPGIFAPMAVGVFTHEEGVRGNESYIVATPQDIIASIFWGERSLGAFADIVPVWPDLYLPSFARYRQMVLSASPKGAGNAYECRMELKRLLPPYLHKWLTWARKATRRRKRELLESLAYPALGPTAGRLEIVEWTMDRANWPEWYAGHTKAELLVLGCELIPDWEHLVGDRTNVITGNTVLPPKVLAQVRDYIDPLDFWRAATGKVKSTEVAGLVNHQMELGL